MLVLDSNQRCRLSGGVLTTRRMSGSRVSRAQVTVSQGSADCAVGFSSDIHRGIEPRSSRSATSPADACTVIDYSGYSLFVILSALRSRAYRSYLFESHGSDLRGTLLSDLMNLSYTVLLCLCTFLIGNSNTSHVDSSGARRLRLRP